MFELDLFPARDGDALVLTWGENANPKRILIDAGRESGWLAIKKAYEHLPEAQRTFELLVVSHIDADHIAGVLKMLADPARPLRFKEVWFNAYHHLVGGSWETFGVAQGEALSDLLKERPALWNTRFGGKAVVIEEDAALPRFTIEGLELTLLSPTRAKLQALAPEWKAWLNAEGLGRGQSPDGEAALPTIVPEGYETFGPLPDVQALADSRQSEDDKAPNGSSIAFAAAYGEKRVLLTADAHHKVLTSSLSSVSVNERRFDMVKLSHHGSQGNLSRALLDTLDCHRFAISTDGSRHHHPDPEAIARLLLWKLGSKHLYFNYRQEEAVMWDDDRLKQAHDYDCTYSAEENMGRLTIPI